MRRWKPLPKDDGKGLLWFGGIWLGVGALFLAVGLGVGAHTLHLQERLDNEARVVEGMVLEKWIRRGSGGRRGEGTSYWVGYRFTTKDGVLVKGQAKVSGDHWDRLVERESLRITYLPDDPGTHRIEGETSEWVLPLVFGGLGLVFSTIGGVIVFRSRTRRPVAKKRIKP